MQTPTPEIRQALYRRLLSALPMDTITEADIAWPNAQFKPQVGRMYLAPWCMFGDTVTKSLSSNGFELLAGVFQINVYGILNQGEAMIDNICRQLVDLYRAGTSLEIPCFNPLTIMKSYRSGLRIEKEPARPVATVSANWVQYIQKGE